MNLNKPFENIIEISFKALQKNHNDCNGKYIAYSVVDKNWVKISENEIQFKITDCYKQKVYDINILFVNKTFFIDSRYLSEDRFAYGLQCYLIDNTVLKDTMILYQNFGCEDIKELYIHIKYDSTTVNNLSS